MTRIVLKASEVAAIIGRNTYKPRQDVLNEMWKKYSPSTFKGLTKKDKAEESLKMSADAQRVLNSAVSIKAKSSDEVQKVFAEAQEKINLDPKLNATQKAEVIEHIRSEVYTSHGTRSEDRTETKVQEIKTDVEETKKRYKVAEVQAQMAANDAVAAIEAVQPIVVAVQAATTVYKKAIETEEVIVQKVAEIEKIRKDTKVLVKKAVDVDEIRRLKQEELEILRTKKALENEEREAKKKIEEARQAQEELERKEMAARERARIAQERKEAANAEQMRWKELVDRKSQVADMLPGNLIRDDSFYDIFVCQIDDNRYIVTGKIDRIEVCPDGSRTLVEIKNRTNRLFRRVVEYENIQIQVYLQMLGLVRARLVEQYNSQVASHDVERDDEMWENEILPKLNEFCIELHESMNA